MYVLVLKKKKYYLIIESIKDINLKNIKFDIKNKQLNSSDALNLLSDHDAETRKEAAGSIESVFKDNSKIFTFITNTLAKDKITNDKWRNYSQRKCW